MDELKREVIEILKELKTNQDTNRTTTTDEKITLFIASLLEEENV